MFKNALHNHLPFSFVLIIFGILLVPNPLIALDVQFSRNLRLGDTGVDIRNLQKILNNDPRTIVSQSGIGSNGKESMYFGQKTKTAVMKFQAIHLPEALGVGSEAIAPTGFVGILTRSKLNTLSPSSGVPSSRQTVINNGEIPKNIPVPLQTETAFSVPQARQKTQQELTSLSFFNSSVYKTEPKLINLSRYEARQGMEVTVNGFGFLPQGNRVHFGSKHIIDAIPNTEGTAVVFVIPNNVNNGKYNVYVSNANGNTQNLLVGDFFTVTDTPRESPLVEQVSLSTSDGKKIIIRGKNFDTINNTIYSNFGTLENVSSQDGKTITVQLLDFSNYKTVKPIPDMTFEIPLYVFVKNDGGISTAPAPVMLTF